MRKVSSRAVVKSVNQQDFVAIWSITLWGLAAVYLLITFQVY